MNVLVDTCIWSLALRRKSTAKIDPNVLRLKDLILDSNARVIGPIRQELLSGVTNPSQFDLLKDRLHAFPDIEIQMADYELAASYYNICWSKGIQGSNTDFLICSISVQHQMPIFTTDKDFTLFKGHLPIHLF